MILNIILKNYFRCKIKNNLLEMKINTFLQMEEEFEDLKEKVKYDEGKFLENDRKDNEIIILRRENSILKKEIIKLEEKNKNYEDEFKREEDIINSLKHKIAELNKKFSDVSDTNTKKVNENDNNTSNHNISIKILNCKNLIDNYNMKTKKVFLDSFSKKYKQTYNSDFSEIDANNGRNIRLLFKNKISNFNSSVSNINKPQQNNNKNIFIRCLNINKNNIKKIKSKSVSMEGEKKNNSNNKNINFKKFTENKTNSFRIKKKPKNRYKLKSFWRSIINKNYSQDEIKIN